MQKLVLLGDEAIAQAAIDSGISGAYAYPGTPSTEITEYLHRSKEARNKEINVSWTANEKTSVEAALGMSYAGKRSIVSMKHVGLNVAADAFVNSGVTGVNGGMLVVAADDPSMHSSQNEQDSRFYGKFSFIPVFEPENQQQAYDMTHYAFELSEKYKVPVLMRITTRLAHSRAGVTTKAKREQNKFALPENRTQFVLLPSIARKQYKELLEKQPALEKEAKESGYNKYIDGSDKSLGIITTGIAYNYLMENYQNSDLDYPILKIAQYPTPVDMVRELYEKVDELLIIEEGFPFVEEQIKGMLDLGKKVHGRLDGTLPRDGELNPNLVAKALTGVTEGSLEMPKIVAGRPPALCPGCPHTDSYEALNEVLEEYGAGRVFSDIGCYTLAALKPLEAINSCVDMGASVTMAKGAADAGMKPSVAVIGDSTFTHSGITGLLDAVKDQSSLTVLILDNYTTGMTGGQDSHATGRLEDICLGLGVEEDHLHVLNPIKKKHEENMAIIKKELDYDGPSVIIPRRECIVTLKAKLSAKKKKKQKEVTK